MNGTEGAVRSRRGMLNAPFTGVSAKASAGGPDSGVEDEVTEVSPSPGNHGIYFLHLREGI